MRPKTTLITGLFAVVLLGCVNEKTVTSSATISPSPLPLASKFFSTFSLPELVGENKLLWKDLCSSEGGGGGGPAPESDKNSRRRSDGLMCRINDSVGDKFKEKEKAFLESLKSDVERRIAESGAKVVETGEASPAGFYFEYSEGDVNGRIEFVSKRTDSHYYSLRVELTERGKD